MPYLEKLKMLKEERNLTNAEIAELSNLPLATITRVFNGSTPNPTFETFTRIAIALGVSLDEIAGLKQPDELPLTTPIVDAFNSYSELLKDKDDRIQELKADKQQLIEDKEAIRMKNNKLLLALVCSVTTLLVVLGVLITIIVITH